MINILLLFIFFSPTHSFAKSCTGATAFIVNGSPASSDNCDFYNDMDRASKALHNFPCQVSFGPKKGRTTYSCKGEKGSFQAGKKSDYKASFPILKKQVLEHAKKLKGKPFVIYFTDHGGHSDGESDVSIGDESMSVADQRELLEIVSKHSPESKIITINDHCYSGGMLDSAYENQNIVKPIKNTCGFSSSTRHEVAYTDESFMKNIEDFNSISMNIDNTQIEIDKMDKTFEDTNSVWNRTVVGMINLNGNQIVNNELKIITEKRKASTFKLFELGKRREAINKITGDLDFHKAYQVYKSESYTLSTPYSSSELFLEKYFNKNDVKGTMYDLDFSRDLSELALQCLVSNDGEMDSFLKVTTNPLFKNILDEAELALRNADYKIKKKYVVKSFDDFNETLLGQEKEIKNLLSKKGEYHSIMSEIFWKFWPHSDEYFDLQEKLNSSEDDESEKFKNMKKRYDELDSLSAIAWNDNEQIPEIKKIKEEEVSNNERLGLKNMKLRDFRKYHSALIRLNAIKAMMKKRDVEALGDYMNIIDCENTVVGKF